MVVILADGLNEAWLDAPAANSNDFMWQYPADRLLAVPERLKPKEEKPTLTPVKGGLL